jgi:hypothetical protein
VCERMYLVLLFVGGVCCWCVTKAVGTAAIGFVCVTKAVGTAAPTNATDTIA